LVRGEHVANAIAVFDCIDHDLLLRAVRKHTDCPWALLYIERWLKAPAQLEDSSIVQSPAGQPVPALLLR
jgi:RNA-directed DNA polymerase